MKTFYPFLLILLTLISCKKNTPDNLIGKWEICKIEFVTEDNFWFFDKKEKNEDPVDDEIFYWDFFENGILVESYNETEINNDTMTYNLYSNNDSINIGGTPCKILKCSNNDFHIEYADTKFGLIRMYFTK